MLGALAAVFAIGFRGLLGRLVLYYEKGGLAVSY